MTGPYETCPGWAGEPREEAQPQVDEAACQGQGDDLPSRSAIGDFRIQVCLAESHCCQPPASMKKASLLPLVWNFTPGANIGFVISMARWATVKFVRLRPPGSWPAMIAIWVNDQPKTMPAENRLELSGFEPCPCTCSRAHFTNTSLAKAGSVRSFCPGFVIHQL